ncbi:uncharacterized protein LOC111121826 isoform X1 [Crassostrea virginica]|uniref:Uncharacterized protein LOC111121826 isoform X1 n=1 Tax=Crassostrea virginica TaxID=6565 RepID=A0A8B8CUR4_CRAVI|nr:uncharacterized protein LOC111121826 isoform X1 [Crassostrea virginica]XP_022318968.1 uncharacterized protein LOC111121826 isoform X1 [Crassostrea virginica]XP_022318969.1 uncharacterized protein LOC111121826 isoform X1 [Crassostrea virginica]
MRKEDILLLHISMIVSIKYAFSIDCYVCTSLNGQNQACEDKFQRDLTTSLFINRTCYFAYFKGTHCIKLKGIRADGSSILVRQCGDYDWGSHCGDILYDAGDGREELVDGCLESCNHDGCNSAIQNKWSVTLFLFTFLCIRYVFEFC